jgi:transcriptional regulator with XRE-family HTH domain
MKTFKAFVKSLPKEERESIARGTAEKVTAIRLQMAREAAGLTQQAVATRLGVTQANLSRLEHRADVKLGTLIQYAEALGGHLKIHISIKGKDLSLVG